MKLINNSKNKLNSKKLIPNVTQPSNYGPTICLKKIYYNLYRHITTVIININNIIINLYKAYTMQLRCKKEPPKSFFIQ